MIQNNRFTETLGNFVKTDNIGLCKFGALEILWVGAKVDRLQPWHFSNMFDISTDHTRPNRFKLTVPGPGFTKILKQEFLLKYNIFGYIYVVLR